MNGYLIAELDVTNRDLFYNQYMVAVKPVLHKYGARVLVATDKPEVIEGGRIVKRVILLEFESPEQARNFYFSNEYQEVAQLRFESAKTHLSILDGLA